MPWVEPDTHGWLLKPASDSDWRALVDEYGGAYPLPLQQVLSVVRESGCRTVVTENRYVDLDWRSDYSAFWSLRFQSPPAFGRRLHFFSRELADEELHDLSADPQYLGYCVLRPIGQGRVGRTLLAPPPGLDGATLALVDDEVSFFGNRLSIRGVPFCQQDGEFFRCAQAAAWMCHYSAVRKGLVGRHSTASIVEQTPSLLSPERALPSKGMNLNQLQAVFGALGQPALFYGLTNMPKVRGVPDPPTPPPLPGENEPPHPGYWDTRIFSVICRYLNSGFPVLVGGRDHAFVLVGWFRDRDDVRFVATDDQIGPYQVIDSPFTHYKSPWHSIMIPLPPKVFLSGEAAESKAYRQLLGVARGAAPLQPLGDALTSGRIQLRSALKEVREFKEDVARLSSTADVLRLLRLARLPHWIWLVEAHDTEACARDDPCVYAVMHYDSTSSDLDPALCALTVPGAVVAYPPDGGQVVTTQGGPAPWESMLVAH